MKNYVSDFINMNSKVVYYSNRHSNLERRHKQTCTEAKATTHGG